MARSGTATTFKRAPSEGQGCSSHKDVGGHRDGAHPQDFRWHLWRPCYLVEASSALVNGPPVLFRQSRGVLMHAKCKVGWAFSRGGAGKYVLTPGVRPQPAFDLPRRFRTQELVSCSYLRELLPDSAESPRLVSGLSHMLPDGPKCDSSLW